MAALELKGAIFAGRLLAGVVLSAISRFNNYDGLVDLHVCCGTFGTAERHPCAKAHRALTAAGHQPTVVTGGCYGTDRLWSRRRAIRRLTGNYKVPTLFLEDGTIIDDTDNIVAWAAANPIVRSPTLSPTTKAALPDGPRGLGRPSDGALAGSSPSGRPG